MQIRQLTNQEYTNFVQHFPYQSPYQTKEYAFIMNRQGYDSICLGLVENNTILAASLILIHKEHGFKYGYAPKGFLIDYHDIQLVDIFTKEIKKYLGKHDVIAIKVNPPIIKNIYDSKYRLLSINPEYPTIFQMLKNMGYYHLGYNNFFEALKPRFEAVIDMKPGYIASFRNMKKEFKTKVRSAERNGVEIYKGSFEELPYLYQQTKNKYPRDLQYFQDVFYYFQKENMVDYYYAKLNTAVYLKHTQKMFLDEEDNNTKLNDALLKSNKESRGKILNQKLQSDKVLNKYKNQLVYAISLLRDHPDGIIMATALFIKQSNQVYMYMDGYDEKYKSFNAKHLLLWKAIEKYSKLGYPSFNLGGLSNFLKSQHKYAGLNEFKLSFGANVVEYIGDLELICNKPLYLMYRNSAPLRNILKSKLTK